MQTRSEAEKKSKDANCPSCYCVTKRQLKGNCYLTKQIVSIAPVFLIKDGREKKKKHSIFL